MPQHAKAGTRRAGGTCARQDRRRLAEARQVAALVKDRVPHGVELPRGYIVWDGALFSAQVLGNHHACGRNGSYVDGDFATREAFLRFVEDLAGNWLDEVNDFLEKRANQEESAAELLNALATQLSIPAQLQPAI